MKMRIPEAHLGPVGPPSSALPNIFIFRLTNNTNIANKAHIRYIITLNKSVPEW